MLRRGPLAAVALLGSAAPAAAQAPIPEGPQAGSLKPFIGAPAAQNPGEAVDPPQGRHRAKRVKRVRRRWRTATAAGQGSEGAARSARTNVTRRTNDPSDVTLGSYNPQTSLQPGVLVPRVTFVHPLTFPTHSR